VIDSVVRGPLSLQAQPGVCEWVRGVESAGQAWQAGEWVLLAVLQPKIKTPLWFVLIAVRRGSVSRACPKMLVCYWQLGPRVTLPAICGTHP
jgi:hypothetical protein